MVRLVVERIRLVRAKYPQADGRAVAKRKRSVDKFRGPLLVFCECLVKRLIKAGFAVEYQVLSNGPEAILVRIVNALGVTDRFLKTLSLLVQVLERKFQVLVDQVDDVLSFARVYSLWLGYAGPGRVVWVRWHPGLRRGVAPVVKFELRDEGPIPGYVPF